jgi:hypothetical protein
MNAKITICLRSEVSCRRKPIIFRAWLGFPTNLDTNGKVLSNGVMFATSSLSKNDDIWFAILASNFDIPFRALWVLEDTEGVRTMEGAWQVEECEGGL